MVLITYYYRGTNEAVKQAHQLLSSLQQDPTKEITQLLQQLKVSSSSSSSATKQQSVVQDGLLALPIMDIATSDQQRRVPGRPGHEISKQPALRSAPPVPAVSLGASGGNDGGSQQSLTKSVGGVAAALRPQRSLQPERKLASFITSHATVERASHPNTSVPLLGHVPPVSLPTSSSVAARASGPVRQLFTSATSTTAALVASMPTPPSPSPSQSTAQPRSVPTQVRPVSSSATTTVTTRSTSEVQRHPPPPPPPPHTTATKTTVPAPKPTSSLPSDITASVSSSKPHPPLSKQLSIPVSSSSSAPTSSAEQTQNVFEQILKTPSIFQEAASQIAQPKKYSDAVGKKHAAVTSAEPTLSSHTLKSATVGSMAPFISPVGSGAPKASINRAPGSRPLSSDLVSKVCLCLSVCLSCLFVCLCVCVCACLHCTVLTAGYCPFISHSIREACPAWSFMERHC